MQSMSGNWNGICAGLFDKEILKNNPSLDEIDEIVYFKLEELIHESETEKAKFSGSFLHIFSLIKAKLSHYSRES